MFLTTIGLSLCLLQSARTTSTPHQHSAPQPTSVFVGGEIAQLPLNDPFGKLGVERITTYGSGVSLVTTGVWWEFKSNILVGPPATKQRDIDVSAHMSNELLGLRWGIGAGYRESKSHHAVFTMHDADIATSRRMRVGMGLLEVGSGDYNARSMRFALISGWYTNTYTSVMHMASFRGTEMLALDESVIAGARLSGSNLRFARAQLHGSLQYARLVGGHSPFVPREQWTLIAGGRMPVWTRRAPRGLYLGVEGYFNSVTPALIPDSTVRLNLTWRFR